MRLASGLTLGVPDLFFRFLMGCKGLFRFGVSVLECMASGCLAAVFLNPKP